ncbi:hypothetical protein K438DRAFT_2149366 [Mycena galopus ATCC 62051]|nr:hypothetical protein K438DRAFT_2149366 [Mycena galopus ATCC 62051]
MPTIDLRRRLIELDAQIAEHRHVLHQLEETRIAVEHELDAASFPVLSLPAEITAEIFVHCLPPFANLGWSRRLEQDENSAPAVLMRVCRVWRDIALATHALWSVLDLPFDSVSTIPNLRSVDGFIDQRLGRAGQYPLSFVLRATSLQDDDEVVFLANLIHRYSHRIQYLELYISELQIHQLGLGSLDSPLLESASLNCNRRSDVQHNGFHHAPRLREFRLGTISESYPPIRLTLPWLQLTKFEGSIQDLRLFVQAPNLTEVTCSLDLGNSLTAITHTHLNSLTVMQGAHIILANLTLPALQHLDVSYGELYNELEGFLMRSSPPLLSLSVVAEDEAFKWKQCLAHVAGTLENFQLKSPSSTIISLLFPIWGSSLLSPSRFPNIRSLSLKDVKSDNGPNYLGLLNFLYARSDRLRSFRLVWDFSPFLDARYSAGHRDTQTPAMDARHLSRLARAGTVNAEDRGHRLPETVETVSGHLSRLARAGMVIYLGTEDENYAATPHAFMPLR